VSASPLAWQAGQPAPRWTWHSLGLAAVCTLAFFLAVPLLETLRTLSPQASTDVREMPFRPEPPAPPPPRPLEAEAPPTSQPELAVPAPPSLSLPAPSFSAPSLDAPLLPFAPRAQWRTDSPAFTLAPPALPSIFEVGELDQAPRPLSQIRPIYPPRARMQRVEGWVELEFVVGTDGSVGELRATARDPDETFVEPALQAARRWRFEPGQRDGQAVPTRVRQRVTFQLQ